MCGPLQDVSLQLPSDLANRTNGEERRVVVQCHLVGNGIQKSKNFTPSLIHSHLQPIEILYLSLTHMAGSTFKCLLLPQLVCLVRPETNVHMAYKLRGKDLCVVGR